MAENAAHLTSTASPLPSIFEVIAQDSLNSTIYPALQKIISVFTTYNPKKYEFLSKYCDEVYLIVNGLIQFHYIKKYDASFSEYFYGLKRVSVLTDKPQISFNQKKLSFIFLVLLPYLKIKLEDKLSIYRLELSDNILLNDWKRKFKALLCSCQGVVHFSWILWSISYYLQYMSGKKDIHTPVLKLLALKLTYADNEQNTSAFWNALCRGHLTIPQLAIGLVQQIWSNSLEIGAFFVQFLQSWQNENSHINITSLPTPDPPQFHVRSADFKGKCPLCLLNWKVPTVVSTSGFIYCFRCIVKHVQESNTCPITRLPITMADIIRLYD